MNHDFINMPSREELIQKTKDYIDKICESKDPTSVVTFSLSEDNYPQVSVIKKQSCPLSSVDKLYEDIDKCIADLVSARINKDVFAEGRALFTMESLMVATMQELSYIHDFLTTNKS